VQEIDAQSINLRVAEAGLTGRRIAPVEIAGTRAWLKNFDQPSPSEWHGIQRALAFVSRLRVLRPVPALDKIEGAENEIAAMQAFREIGVRVPELLWAEGARLLISDIGPTIRDEQRHRARVGGVAKACLAAARELSRVHTRGLVHGRPILRNITWDGATVGFIDFEETPTKVMPLETAQARDVLLFLMSLGRRMDKEFLHKAFAAYAGNARPEVDRELRRVVHRSALLLKPPFSKAATAQSQTLRGVVVALGTLFDTLETS
jgi:tRNA A-37 threonylcarbamoyl transferase component Bud32